MKISLAQINPTVGDIRGNTRMIVESIRQAKKEGAHLVVFPELAICGYPPKDLLLRDEFVDHCEKAVNDIEQECVDITAIIGTVTRNRTGIGRSLHNTAVVCAYGVILHSYHKRLLPAYDVFDERRYFEPGQGSLQVPIYDGQKWRHVGVLICEDIWTEAVDEQELYNENPVAETIAAGADILVCISASPFYVGKPDLRRNLIHSYAKKYNVPLIFVNQVGGNDDLIFDGNSMVVWPFGTVSIAPLFEEDFMTVDLNVWRNIPNDRLRSVLQYDNNIDNVFDALVLGVRDYVCKCGFKNVIIGLSGGIDSALTAAIAVKALGSEHVYGVGMPSRHSSEHSLDDANLLAINLGIDFDIIPIEPAHRAFESMLAPSFTGSEEDVTEENIQARIRGNILMALSNKFGRLVLTTGNKSELAVGYCTLYGDMCGGLAVISDVPKTMVYELSRYVNDREFREIIPINTITKPPSAELKPGQVDQDSLPPYETLDFILKRHVEKKSFQQIRIDLDTFHCGDKVTDQQLQCIIDLVNRNEYKRQQAAVGLKITSQAFGSGWKFPIAVNCRF